jgi:hypothetical protein
MAWERLGSSDLNAVEIFIAQDESEIGNTISRLLGGIRNFLLEASAHGQIHVLKQQSVILGVLVTTKGSLDRHFEDQQTEHISLIMLHPTKRCGRNFLRGYLLAGEIAINDGAQYIEFKARQSDSKNLRLYTKFADIAGETINIVGDKATLFKTKTNDFISRLLAFERRASRGL